MSSTVWTKTERATGHIFSQLSMDNICDILASVQETVAQAHVEVQRHKNGNGQDKGRAQRPHGDCVQSHLLFIFGMLKGSNPIDKVEVAS